MKRLLLLTMLTLATLGISAQRFTDKLTRGLVAVPQGDKTGQDDRYGVSGSGIFVQWRILPTEYYDTKYNLYRGGAKIAGDLTASNYQDNSGTKTSKYSVVPVVRGVERTDLASEAVTPWEHQYWDIPVANVVNRAGKDVTSQYSLNDCSVADVDGDGQMEFVVKRRNDSGLNVSGNTTTFNRHECYKMDGTLLWYIDMGPNLMAGPDEQFDLILYDWDMDGRAEALMRGADNMIIHTASGREIKIGNMNYYAPRDEYTKEGNEYLLYINGQTGEPYGWDGQDNWTPQDYPLPRFESGERDYATVWGSGDTGHRATKHYFGAPYLDGRTPAIFLGRGCYTRHKFCALQVDPATHELTQLWRWNCYDSSSPWFGNGFHNFAIADVDMDGRDEIVFGSMIIDDTGYGLSTTGYGHGDAQHCGDLDPYRWGLEQFVCLEGRDVPGVCYTGATASDIRYQNGAGGDNGRAMAGNFQSVYPGSVARSAEGGLISLVADKVIEGAKQMASDDYWNMRVYWDGDLLSEFMDSPGVERSPCVYKYGGQREVGTGRAAYANDRVWMGGGSLNNSSKNNPGFLGDILGDWREEIVVRADQALRIYITSYPSQWGITTLWADHEYRNAMTWQSVGYNQPPHPSFFLGELEDITKEPPALTLEGRTEVTGNIQTTDDHLLISGYEDKTVSVDEGASPYILTVNTPAWVQGSGSRQATSGTPKQPRRDVVSYTTTLTGGAFAGQTRLVKQGEGTLVLPNVIERHTGETDVWQGTLRFDGTFESSPLWLNRHTTLLSDGGRFMGGIKAYYNTTIQPGGEAHVGSITTTDLQLGFGARVAIDVEGKTFDQLNATSLTVEQKTWEYGPRYKAPVLQFVGADKVPSGEYVLGLVESVSGPLNEVIIEGFPTSAKTSLKHDDGRLIIVVETTRESDVAYWNGTDGDATWQQAVSENFCLYDGTSTYSAHDDDIVFDDRAAVTDVVIKGAVSPRSVTFANETKAYTVTGDSIVGGGTITKNGAAKVTINNENRTGDTYLNKGVLEVNMLANTAGQDYGSLGSAKSAVNMADGTTLRTNGTMITDQQLNVEGSVSIDVPTSRSVIFNKGIRGEGATVTKTGAGTMETGIDNTYSKLIVQQGRVNSNQKGSVDQLPATVEFAGGTLWGANDESVSITNRSNFVVPQGRTGTFYSSFRGTYHGTLTGAGTFNVYSGGVRAYWHGDWSQFTGTVKVGKSNRQNKKSYQPGFDFNNSYGLPNATLSVDEGVLCSNGGHDFPLGAATGSGTLVGSGNWILGSNNKDIYLNMEIGVTSERTDDYGGTIAKSATKLIKRGTGRMVIMSVGKLNCALTVEEGTFTFNNSALDQLVVGSNTTTVKQNGRIVGQGFFNALTMESGAELIPCGSFSNETTPGTIKTGAMMRVNDGATVNFLFNATKQSTLQPAFLTMNGTVKVTLLNGYTPKVGDEFTLWTVTRTFSGTPHFDLPELPEGLYWDTRDVAKANGVLRVTDDGSLGIGRLAADAEVSCEVYDLSGVRVATFGSIKAEAAAQVQRMPLSQGTYILKMHNKQRTEVSKVVVK